MHPQRKTRRSYGTGRLYQKGGSWYGRWRAGDRRVNRKLGPVRQPGSRDGLTRAGAEQALRKAMEAGTVVHSSATDRVTVAAAGGRLIDHLETLGRKPSTIGVYRSLLRTHLAVHLAGRSLDRVGPEHVERLIAGMRDRGAGPKTTVNAMTLLSQVFEFGRRKGWCQTNPCSLVDRPRLEDDVEIRYLTMVELESLVAAVPADPLGATDRVLYLTAAMTGLRQGELLALRWRDVDWPAARLRVRRNYVRGHWGTPKSKRSSRAVPLADRLAGGSIGTSSGRRTRATTTWCSLTPSSAPCSTTPV